MRKNTKRFLSTIAIAAAMSLAAPIAAAQDEAAESESEDRVLDTVEVVGVQNDAAMAAFRAGDFETAEIEFLDNAMCALRRERNVRASVDTAQINSQRAEVFTNSTTTDSGASSQGANAGAGQTTPTGVAATDGVAARNLRNTYDRTCDAKARQLYFAGLSQIQLGKTNEALRSFEKATASSRILYDAHYKIGLIKLLTGDTRKAESELQKMEGILKRCRDCEAKQEIVDRIDHLSKAINGEVSLQ
ncbi:MAG: hypothetical protein NXH70_01500 [Hyphomonas sp.]|jgi:tetratricopeptide (TPR) repeat protein|nr:hypothetical protein [Hyphomonas sp.]